MFSSEENAPRASDLDSDRVMRRAIADAPRGLNVWAGSSLGHLRLCTSVDRSIHEESIPRPFDLDSDRVVRRAIADASRGLNV